VEDAKMARSVTTPTRAQIDAEIKRTILDYVHGWDDADPARMERSLHPALVKRIVRPGDWPSSSSLAGDRLDEMSALRLVQLSRRDPTPASKWGPKTEARLLDRFGDVASVKIGHDAPWDWDYAHLARWNGTWLILNVLWGIQPKRPGDVDDDAAITRTALDYLESCYDGDAEKMERSLHPGLAKRRVIPDGSPPTAIFPGDRLEEISALSLVRLTERPGEAAATVAPGWRAEVTILDRCANAATVRADANTWIDYVHLGKWNGRWAIINVLWALRPKTETS
jgi:hypothetical protein